MSPDAVPQVADLLSSLVDISSVNPLLTDEPGHDESRLADFVESFFKELSIKVERQEVRDGRYNVVAHLPRRGTADDAVLLLSAHMDTYPRGGPHADYEAVVEGRTLHGRGSADAKGSLAAMMVALARAASTDDHREVHLAATVDEECLLAGVRALVERGPRPTLAITGEPTRLAPVVGQKGIVRGSVRLSGSPVHAAYPTGSSVVDHVGQLVRAVADVNAAWAADPPHRVAGIELGSPTFTLTRIVTDGGMNQVACEAEAWFDGRFLPGQTGEEFVRETGARLRARLGASVALEVGPLSFVSPPNAARPDAPVVSELFGHIARATGGCVPETFSYGSEAGVLAEVADDSLVLGPGDPRFSHAAVESIDLDEVDRAVDIFHHLITGGL